MIPGASVSLRFRHAVLDVVPLASAIGFTSKFGWQAGDQMMTPKGQLLDGQRSESYCVCPINFPSASTLEELLKSLVLQFKNNADLIENFAAQEVKVSVFMTLETGAFEGANLPASLLADLARCKISLEIDRY